MSTAAERYDQLLRAYLIEPDPAKSDAILKEVLAAGRMVDEGPAPQPTIADLIAAEQARARRLHPDDHAGHRDVMHDDHFFALTSEVDEVENAIGFGHPAADVAHELIQVAGVAAAWAERVMADWNITAADMLAIIEADQ